MCVLAVSTGFPGHALYEKGLWRQKGIGPLVSSQERRALLVPMINLSSTARCVPPFDFHRISFVHASEETSRTVVPIALESKMDSCLLGAPNRRCPASPQLTRPRPAARLCADPPHPARGIFCFWIRQVFPLVCGNGQKRNESPRVCTKHKSKPHPVESRILEVSTFGLLGQAVPVETDGSSGTKESIDYLRAAQCS